MAKTIFDRDSYLATLLIVEKRYKHFEHLFTDTDQWVDFINEKMAEEYINNSEGAY